MRQESISLFKNLDSTWVCIFLHSDLKGCFMVIEQNTKDGYVSTNPENVHKWLKLLFKTHPEIIQMKVDCKWKFREAMQELKKGKELAEIMMITKNLKVCCTLKKDLKVMMH